MGKIPLSGRETAVWGGVIGALILLGVVGVATRKKAAREEAPRPPQDPYRAVIAQVNKAELHTASAHAYEAEGNTAMAIGEYRELVRLNPDDLTAHGMLAALYFKAGDRDRAVAEVLEILRIDPSRWAQRELLADTYAEMGDYERAGREYEEVLRYARGHAGVRCKLGRAYLALGRPGPARDEFRKAAKEDPKSLEAHRGLEASLRAMGDAAGAAREAGVLKGLPPNDAEQLTPGRMPAFRPLRARTLRPR